MQDHFRIAVLTMLVITAFTLSAHAIGVTTLTPIIDFDSDGLNDTFDVSPGVYDPAQFSTDLDGIGDAAENFMGTNPSLTDTDGDGFIDYVDSAPLGDGLNAAHFNTPYVVNFDPLYTVALGDTLLLDFTFTHATGASDGYLRVAFDLALNGAGDDFWYTCDASTFTAVLIPADLTTLGINAPGLYSVSTVGGEFGWVSNDSFIIRVVPEPGTMAMVLVGMAGLIVTARRFKR